MGFCDCLWLEGYLGHSVVYGFWCVGFGHRGGLRDVSKHRHRILDLPAQHAGERLCKGPGCEREQMSPKLTVNKNLTLAVKTGCEYHLSFACIA